MIHSVLKDSVRIANCAGFYGGVAVKTAKSALPPPLLVQRL